MRAATAACRGTVCGGDEDCLGQADGDQGLGAALAIKRRFPEIGVLVHSQYVLREYATELLSTETVGVGYLPKNRVTDLDHFLESVYRIAEGGTVIYPEVVRHLLNSSEKQNSLSALTTRENEVLQAMAEGLSNRGIDERLDVSISSVEKAISPIFDKFRLHAGATTSRRVAVVLHYLDQS